MSDDGKRRGGRPALYPGHQSQTVHLRLPDPVFDALAAIARERDVPLRQVLRDVIERGMKTSVVSVDSCL
jgi:predicted DNA-binding ribbon-helix-helix protein